jgi:hypothetical protein
LKAGRSIAQSTQLNAGNLVKIEDGCATVRGYEFPRPLLACGKAETRLEASSQDTGLVVLVVIVRPRADD